MPETVRVFVSYSHQDSHYLERDSLLGFLQGLKNDGVDFWTDERIATGELWDDEIKAKIAESHIALVLVSQAFLDSDYCSKVEISGFLAEQLPLFPIILSPCEWQRHEWLKTRQFLPGGGKTIEEHYTDPGSRKRLFLKIRTELRDWIERLRAKAKATSGQASPLPANPFVQTLAIRDPAGFIGRQAELRRLRSMLQGGSAALLGQPKIGKSSLLWQLAHAWKGKVLGLIDFQVIEDRDDFYDCLAQELQLGDNGWRNLRKALRETQALLLLDELDSAPGRLLSGEDLGRLRAICNHNPDFDVVTASRSPPRAIFPDSGKGSPGYNFL